MYLEDHFPFVLRYIAVYDVRLLSYVLAQSQLICLSFHLTEHHGATLAAAVHLQDCSDGGGTVMVAAADCKVLCNSTMSISLSNLKE